MALQFPTSPTDGQVYPAAPNSEYIYSVAKGAWLSLPNQEAKTVTSDTAPSNPKDGDQWFKTTDGTFYIYVVDPDGGQWVESQAPITANGYYSPNYIINGAFDINQRGLSSSGITTQGTYGFDRWRLYTVGGTTTYSAQKFTPGEAPVAGYEGTNFARIATSGQTLSSSYSILNQQIEGVRTLAGQTATLSFWARAASGAPKVSAEFGQVFGNGGGSTQAIFNAGNVTLSTSWARYSVTFTVPSIAGKTIGTSGDDALYLFLFTSAGADYNARTGSIGIQNNTVDFWGVQLEQGSVATTFRRNANSLQGELAACQRYYCRLTGTAPYINFALGFQTSTSASFFTIYTPVKMRITPTPSYSGIEVSDHIAFGVAINSLGISAGSDSQALQVQAGWPGSQGAAYRPSELRCGASGGYVDFSAEL